MSFENNMNEWSFIFESEMDWIQEVKDLISES